MLEIVSEQVASPELLSITVYLTVHAMKAAILKQVTDSDSHGLLLRGDELA